MDEVLYKISDNFSNTTWTAFILAVLGTVGSFLFGDEIVGYVFVGLMALDLITGIAKCLKCNEKISSEIMGRKTTNKLMSYFLPLLVIVMLAVIGQRLFGDKVAVVYFAMQSFVIMWFSLRESISVLENVDRFCNGTLPFVHVIIRFLKGKQHDIGEQLDELCEPDGVDK